MKNLIIYSLFSVLIPLVTAIYIFSRGKCSIWCVIISPVVGLFLFCMLVVVLMLLSGDM